eukprot:CAMPEP_0183351884 /NCGR_PEP_ID=MMETSP0164_2-20130417/26316_1 /TAXON_ID=221442 /ORGANISM="Coccolithus pelagicus ssp braarudi, Strain PLY182g" /LENGTH=182 /DNA_ID=CAMNT_0025524183 /DNA_START=58 /DNA_END=606 /DNA_ORIENTATION=+
MATHATSPLLAVCRQTEESITKSAREAVIRAASAHLSLTLEPASAQIQSANAQALERYITALLTVSGTPSVGILIAVTFVVKALAAGQDGQDSLHSLLGGALAMVIRASADAPISNTAFENVIGTKVDAWEARLIHLLGQKTDLRHDELLSVSQALEAHIVDAETGVMESLVSCVIASTSTE